MSSEWIFSEIAPHDGEWRGKKRENPLILPLYYNNNVFRFSLLALNLRPRCLWWVDFVKGVLRGVNIFSTEKKVIYGPQSAGNGIFSSPLRVRGYFLLFKEKYFSMDCLRIPARLAYGYLIREKNENKKIALPIE